MPLWANATDAMAAPMSALANLLFIIYIYMTHEKMNFTFRGANLLKKIEIKARNINNISYFCIVKRFKSILRPLFAMMLLVFASSMNVHAYMTMTQKYEQHIDSTIYLGLLTCQPSQEVYSLYGHTAIHYVNRDQGIDVAINYGMFSFSKPYFVLRFILGLTDYEMGVQPFDLFCMSYAAEQRGITEQILNVPALEKIKIAEAIERNYLPENREYRYNYFYDNCTTRARDMVLGSLKKYIKYKRQDGGPSFRRMIHAYNEEHPWARFGNDMLLGIKADLPTNINEQQFLPDHLMEDFSTAIVNKDNKEWKLVNETKAIIPYFQQNVAKEFPVRPITCSIILLIITVILTFIERSLKISIWYYDLLLLVLSGLSGLILFVMIFSQHPTVSLNLQLLMFNPLPLFFAWRAVKRIRLHQYDCWWKIWGILIILFFIGAFFQCYAEGMILVACSLLLRCSIHIFGTNNK